MNPIITTIILIIGALGLFFTFTKQRYESLDVVKDEIASYEQALTQVSRLEGMISSLTEQSKQLTPEEVDRITKAIPQNIDNVRLIIEVDSLAKSLGLNVTNLTIREKEKTNETLPSQTINQTENKQEEAVSLRETVLSTDSYRSVDMTFTVDASYEDFKKLIKKLEKSLRFMDIQSINSSTQTITGANTYTVTFTTYWLGS